MLSNIFDEPDDIARVKRASAKPALASLNASASPLLTLCSAPECAADEDMLLLTLLHKRADIGPAHDPPRGIVEQWVRPATHFLRRSSTSSASALIAEAARTGGLSAAAPSRRADTRGAAPSTGTTSMIGSCCGGSACSLLACSRRAPTGAPSPSATAASRARRPLCTSVTLATGHGAACAQRRRTHEMRTEDIELSGNLPVLALAISGDSSSPMRAKTTHASSTHLPRGRSPGQRRASPLNEWRRRHARRR